MNNHEYRQLLCTFSNPSDFKKVAGDIGKFYSVYNNRVFVFTNTNNSSEIYLSYNVVNMIKQEQKFPNTILIHRKKQTNTLYTLNAMNRLIAEENGKEDKTFVVNWSLYKNSLIITGDISVRIIPLKLFQVIDIQR